MTGARAGEVIAGRYRLDRLLGEGGMGSVWAATHAVTGKAVAVKFLKGELASNAGLVGRFIREARAACAVRHPNVVQIHDVLTLDSGAPAMVMDLLEGESLGARLARERRLSVPDFARIMAPVLAAVAAAHAASIVHRDLKPDNLFLARSPDGSTDVKVLDFGIAKINTVEQAGSQLTKTGAMLGTPFYMSPEQLFGEKDIDGRSDVWALGIIFYECLSGVLPTQADNLGQIIKTVTTTGFAPLTSVAPHVPAELSALVHGMLSRDRASRPSDLMAIREVVMRFVGPSGHVVAGPVYLGGTGRPDPALANMPTESEPPSAEAREPVRTTPLYAGGQKTGEIPWGSTLKPTNASRWSVPALAVTAGVLALGGIGVFAVPRIQARLAPHPPAPSAPAPDVSASASAERPPPSAAAVALSAVPTGSSSALDAGAAPPAKSAPPASSGGSRSVPAASAKAAPSSSVPSRPTSVGPLEEKVPF